MKDFLEHYHSAAYHLWAQEGRVSGQTFAAFKSGFADTAATFVRVTGPARTEGAAGTVYAAVPVEVRARLKGGQLQHFAGEYILRRNNTGTGDPASWLWHIDRAALRPVR